ncbi:MAG: putative transcriptional acitvator, Baf family [Bacteroidetes bacterium]|nr:putative transcriptional acitvator, Baf family [Bacteroidota bacterium]
MTNLCIDLGNSSTKTGIFRNDELVETLVYEQLSAYELEKIISKHNIEACILSSVTDIRPDIEDFLTEKIRCFIRLEYQTKVPVENRYLTPQTLGKDRLAAVVGAITLRPNADLLVIDAGTAITYDFVDRNGVYHGGNIAPGIEMRLKALHNYTSKLPLVDLADTEILFGNDTRSAILAGVVNGILFEIEGYINTLKHKIPELSVFLTGGSTFYIDSKLKSAIFAEKNLVLIGLNRILQFNV